MSRSAIVSVLIAFVLSIAVRWPLIDRPLSAHHEFCTAFTLIALTNWWEDGYATHHGMPSGGFIREGEALLPPDRYDRNERARNLYYFSHPPLAFDLPYALFAMAGTAPNAAGLQWFNIVFHLVTALALFHAVRMAVGEEGSQAPLFGAFLYLLLPATLWFHGNAYMSDMFVQVPWVVHLVFAMRVLRHGAVPGRWTWIAYAVTLFLALYTSWLGVFAAVAEVLVAGWLWRRDRRVPLAAVIGWCAVAAVLAFGLTAWRFLQVVDAEALVAQLRSRFAVRGSFGAENGLWPLLKQIAENYRIGFLPVILLLLVLAARSFRRRARPLVFNGDLRLFILLTGLPVLLDHALLLQYAAHDFTVLKAAPLLCGLAGYGLSGLEPRWGRAALALTCVAGVLYFYRTNPLPGRDGGRYVQERELGLFIAAHAAQDDVVFGQGISREPQVLWYARRNIIGIRDAEEARAFLRECGRERGVVISAEAGTLTATHVIARR